MSKTLFLLQSLEQGGAETYLVRFLEYTRLQGAYVLCKSGRGGALEERFRHVATVLLGQKLSLYNPLDYVRFVRYLKAEQFDTVCDLQGNFAGWTLLCARLAGVKRRVAFYRESRNQFRPTPGRRLYARLITEAMVQNATRILSNSRAALEHFHPRLLRTHPERFRIIYNGIDSTQLSTRSRDSVRAELHLPESAFVVGHTGRFAPAKNHATLLKVAIELCHRHADIHFVLIGKNVPLALAPQVEEAGLAHQIHLLNYRPDVLDLLPGLDLYYFPSLNEGQPNALIEAMATGLPFVASDIPSIREAIPATLYGQLVPPLDVEAHVARIETAYQTRTQLSKLTCRDWARTHFDAGRLFGQFLEEVSDSTKSSLSC